MDDHEKLVTLLGRRSARHSADTNDRATRPGRPAASVGTRSGKRRHSSTSAHSFCFAKPRLFRMASLTLRQLGPCMIGFSSDPDRSASPRIVLGTVCVFSRQKWLTCMHDGRIDPFFIMHSSCVRVLKGPPCINRLLRVR